MAVGLWINTNWNQVTRFLISSYEGDFWERTGAWGLERHIEAGAIERETTMKYLIVIEKAGKNYSAYIPDIPGCVATGKTSEEAKERIKEALEFHLEGLKEDGVPTPEAAVPGEYITV